MQLYTNIICLSEPTPSELTLQYSEITFYEDAKVATLTSSNPTVDMLDVGVSISLQSKPITETVEVLIHPCLAGPLVLPRGYMAASPVYLIQQTAGHAQDLSVSVQHCVSLKSENDCSNMTFLSATTVNTPMPIISSIEGSSHTYMFRELEASGKFKSGSNMGETVLQVLVPRFIVVATNEEGITSLTKGLSFHFHPFVLLEFDSCLYSLRLLPTAVKETEVEAVLYSCVCHTIYEKVCHFRYSIAMLKFLVALLVFPHA